MAKKVTGIGNNPKAEGAHIHIVVKGGQALCDKRTVGLKLNRELTVHEVTCTKCMRYSYYKKAIEKPKPEPKATKPKPTKKTAPKKKAPVQKDTKAEDTKAAPPEDTKAQETPEAEPIEPYVDFVAVPNAKGTYAINHVPSDKTFFDSVPSNIIAFALEALNKLLTRWVEGETMPKDYVQTVRKALTKVYKDRNVELPTHLAKPLAKTKKKKPPEPPEGVKVGDRKKVNGALSEWNGTRWVRIQKRILKRRTKPEKPKRVLKRRRKTSKRTLKRRKKEEIKQAPAKVNELNMLLGKPPAFIYDHLKVGVHYGFLIDEMKHKFKMNDAQAKRKFKTVVRQLTRVNELVITHLIVANPNLHFYAIDNTHHAL